MRNLLCNNLAQELKRKVDELGMDLAYNWFTERASAEKLTASEQFYTVLLSGGIKDAVIAELPKTERKAPWVQDTDVNSTYARIPTVIDEAHHPVKPGEFTNLSKRSKKATQPRTPTKRPMPSSSCMRDAKKACGVAPYDVPGNYLVGDGYFANDCRKKYGEKMWDYACELVRKQK